jgi:hypothetical protein
MNRTFREVVNFYKGPGLKLTHEQQVRGPPPFAPRKTAA